MEWNGMEWTLNWKLKAGGRCMNRSLTSPPHSGARRRRLIATDWVRRQHSKDCHAMGNNWPPRAHTVGFQDSLLPNTPIQSPADITAPRAAEGGCHLGGRRRPTGGVLNGDLKRTRECSGRHTRSLTSTTTDQVIRRPSTMLKGTVNPGTGRWKVDGKCRRHLRAMPHTNSL